MKMLSHNNHIRVLFYNVVSWYNGYADNYFLNVYQDFLKIIEKPTIFKNEISRRI